MTVRLRQERSARGASTGNTVLVIAILVIAFALQLAIQVLVGGADPPGRPLMDPETETERRT